MALRKCPKCELNYLKPGETICHVCASAMKRRKAAAVEEEEVVMCFGPTRRICPSKRTWTTKTTTRNKNAPYLCHR